ELRRGKERRRERTLDLLRLVVFDHGARRPGARCARHLRVEILVDEGFGDEAEGLARPILEARHLLVDNAQGAAHVKAHDNAGFQGIALTGGTGEFEYPATGKLVNV